MDTTENQRIVTKDARLLEIVGRYDRIGIAFSGGVDSTVLLAAAQRVLGDNVYALTAVSAIQPTGEKELAIDLAGQLGVRHILFESKELDDPQFLANPPERCYHCKKGLLKTMLAKAGELGIETVAHGANLDDLSDYRPGFKAAQEMGIVAPLIEAEMDKTQIRQLARLWNLSNWDRPAMACLATRIPYNTPINVEVLHRIDQAERFLRQMGIRYCRVRYHDGLARIEVGPDEIERLTSPQTRQQIVDVFRNLGYQHISIDLEGYIAGKMNAGITQ